MCFKLLFLEARGEIDIRETDLPIFGCVETGLGESGCEPGLLFLNHTKNYPLGVFSWRKATGIMQMGQFEELWEGVLGQGSEWG